MSDQEGAALLGRIAAGDDAAMMAFYDRYFGLVAGYCRRMVSDRESADEAIQDTFWQVWRQASRYDPERAAVATWLLVLARSRCLDALRRLEREPPRAGEPFSDAEDASDPPMARLAAPDDVEGLAEQRWTMAAVRRAFATLPEAQRETIRHVYFLGESAGRVADREGVPVGTVKTRLRLGLTKLRRVLEVEIDGP
jgi:RNA polymerase sigma-70 factor (ECF subfamily)